MEGKLNRLVILGGGESGVGAALLAKQKGYDVFLSDGGDIKDKYKQVLIDNGIVFEEGTHTEDKILNAHEIMKSPGIPDSNELVKKVRAKGISVISEIELAYRYKGNSRIIAITGSNGKSTTTSLIYHVCKVAGLDCALVGNIGYSFARQVAEDPKELYVAEISSFQLDDIKTFRPDVAVLLNITEDHLDRYDYKFENYIRSKFRIADYQTKDDYFIYWDDDDVIKQYLRKTTINSKPMAFSMYRELNVGAYIKNDMMNYRLNQGDEEVAMSVYDFAASGKHNQQNAMAAALATSSIGIRKEKIREAVTTFETLEHRMEYVATVRGIDFINDSKGTNVNSVWYALESTVKPTVLILGGKDKGNDYSILDDLVKEKVKAIVCLGVDNTKIHQAFEGMVKVVDTQSAKDAVDTAYALATKGDVVLLSPGCASFDLFKSFEDRGQQFKQAVLNL